VSITKHHITIDCEQCRFCQQDGVGGFDVEVPVHDDELGIEGLARLNGVVHPRAENLTLEDWKDAQGNPLTPSPETYVRLEQALAYLAEHRVCGTHQLCPAEVVKVAEEHSK